MHSVRVQTDAGSYRVLVQPRLLERLAALIGKEIGELRSVFVVTSQEIWSLWGEQFLSSFRSSQEGARPFFVPAGEQHKRLRTVEHLAKQLVEAGAKRDTLLVAFGGGVIGDMAGFLAAIYMRGIRYIGVPTTYLAQVDSSLGGKTGVNLSVGKNLVGSFHHPAAVFSDPVLLSTLPARELRAGLVETMKAAVLGDARLFSWLEGNLDKLLANDEIALTEAITASVKIKAKIVSGDERESGERMLLNLGHTVGHAIEAATHYRALLHGEAVAWGMIAAINVAVARSELDGNQARRIQDLLFRLGPLPQFRASARSLLERTAADKKHSQNAQRFILPTRIGRAVVVEDVGRRELVEAIASMLRTMRERGA
jgi:3-dehydroquinate synthase